MKTYSSLTASEQSTQTSSGALARIDGETAYVQRQQDTAASKLQPAVWEDAKSVVMRLFGLPMRNGTDDEGVIGAMRMACDGEPLWAIKETVADFIVGRVGQGFCPSSAEFGVELRRRTDPHRERLQRARRMAQDIKAQQGQHTGPMSENARKLAAETIARLRAASERERIPPRAEVDPFAEYRSPADAPARSRPLTPEDVADIPDAPKRSMPRIRVPQFAPLSQKDQA